MKRIVFVFALTLSLGVLEASAAPKAVGAFSAVRGFVQVVTGGNGFSKNVSEGDQVYAGDTIITGQNGRVRVVFPEAGRDAEPNVIVLGASSRLVVKRAGDGVNDKGAEMDLQEGSVRAKVKKDYYQGKGRDIFEVKTPNGVAGVRGTTFMVEYDFHRQQSTVATIEGRVVVQDAARRMESIVTEGKFSEITRNAVSKAVDFQNQSGVMEKLRRLDSVTRDLDRPASKGDSASRSRVPAPPSVTASIPSDLPKPPPGIGGGAWSQIRGIPNSAEPGIRSEGEERAVKNLEVENLGGDKPMDSVAVRAISSVPQPVLTVPTIDTTRVREMPKIDPGTTLIDIINVNPPVLIDGGGERSPFTPAPRSALE